MGEQPIFVTSAHVFQIDPETKKKWIPVSSKAVNVSFYYDKLKASYRIISLDDSKTVLINSTILPNMNFSKTSQKFGQWADAKAGTVYGLGFPTEVDLGKFMEKFNEVKDLCRAAVSPAVTPSVHMNGGADKPYTDPKPFTDVPRDKYNAQSSVTNISTSSVVSLNNSAEVARLQAENEKLKMALTQSSSNADQWQKELSTLRASNARLTAALQENSSNVEEWQLQLQTYKDECARLSAKVSELERNSGSTEALQRQLLEAKDKLKTSESVLQQKDDDLTEMKKKFDEMKQLDTQFQRLNIKVQTLDEEKLKLRRQLVESQQQLEEARTTRVSGRQELETLQQQLSSKINDLYEMNDKLADLIQAAV